MTDPLVPFLEFYASMLMQLPKASNDLLMLAPSCIFFAQFNVWIFSDPAKSIMNILELILLF